MRINFNATYRDIQKYTQASVRPTAEQPGFSNLLSEISPNRPKAIDNTKDIAKSEPIISDLDRGPMASYKFEAPKLNLPDFDVPLSPPDQPEVVNPTTESVKSPTILSVRRVQVEGPITSQEREANFSKIRPLIEAAGSKHGIDPALGLAVAEAESSFNPSAVSVDGHKSKGIFQLLDRTGKHLLDKLEVSEKYDPFKPELNVDLGVGYLRHLHEIFSRGAELPNNMSTQAAANSASLEKFAIAAFNAGEGRVAYAQNQAQSNNRDASVYEDVADYLPETTQKYVARVLQLKQNFGPEDFG